MKQGLLVLSIVWVIGSLAVQAKACEVVVEQNGGATAIRLQSGAPFHETTNTITNQQCIEVPNSSAILALWSEVLPDTSTEPWYAVTHDGVNFVRVTRTSYSLKLQYADFDPLQTTPTIPTVLQADANVEFFIVQFVTHALDEFRQTIESLGGTVQGFLPYHAYVVRMNPAVKTQVEALPFVRWVGVFHPAYRLEKYLADNIGEVAGFQSAQAYGILVFESGPNQKQTLGGHIQSIGGAIVNMPNPGRLFQVMLTGPQLLSVIQRDEVMFVGLHRDLEFYVDKARIVGGANYVEALTQFNGDGVRGLVADSLLDVTHPDFQAHVPVSVYRLTQSETRFGSTGAM